MFRPIKNTNGLTSGACRRNFSFPAKRLFPCSTSRHILIGTQIENCVIKNTLLSMSTSDVLPSWGISKKNRYSAVPCGKPCQPSNSPSTHLRCCRKPFETHEEKKTDVNIAVHIIKNCVQGKCDAVYLLSGDNDLVPGLETAKELCPQVRFRVLLPINAKAKTLMSVCKTNGFKYVRIKEQHLVTSQFSDPLVIGSKTYSKPKHWV